MDIWKASFTFFIRIFICAGKGNVKHQKRDININILQKEVNLKNRLEEIRKQGGIKQEELAEAMGVSRQTISSLENGRYNPSVILAIKLARYFGMKVEDIFIYEEEQDEK